MKKFLRLSMALIFCASLILAHGPTIPPDPWAGGGGCDGCKLPPAPPPCESTPADPCFM